MKKSTRKVSQKKIIGTQDLFNLKLPSSVSLSNNESKIAYTVEWMDEKKNKYFQNLHLVDVNSQESTQFTHGNQNDSAAVWSPDDSQIAFISARDKKVGIYLMPTAGGAEKKLIEIDGAISNMQWTPDSKSLVFCLRYNDSHFIEDEKKKKEQPVFRHITKLFYRLDGAGFLPKDKFQIYKLEIATEKLTKLTKGKRDNAAPHLSPDGKYIAFISNRTKDPDIFMDQDDIFIISIHGSKEKKVQTPKGPIHAVKFSPDGKSIAYLGHDNPNDDWGSTNVHIWKVGINGRPKAKDLMPTFDRSAYDESISDMGDVGGGGNINWSKDGKRIYFLGSDLGATNLFYIPARGGKPTRIYNGKCHIKSFSVNGKTQKAAIIYADVNNPGDIQICPTQYGGEKKTVQLTHLNPFLKTKVKLGKTKDVMFKSFDGTKVQGWMVFPPNFNPKKKYPSILNIHGGPRVQYAHTFFHEMQYFASQGFVVFYTNPRGGRGRGEMWAAAITGGWGDLDYKDCMAAADYMESQKFINPKKICVTGGSYGGYMTNWIIGHTNRFKAAVTQRCISDLKSFYGSSDIGWAIRREFDGHPWTDKENYEKCSPITYYQNIKTPVLIIHSEKDLRCHIEQGEQMFAMLKVMK
ncbi:MAG TPA: S9 family peptidase, partial [candidate division Zixibacteria bacterium]|nr:S9 family peptidase [candidate division Zixibacteria bacterium]